jgi:hypothetical protein
MRDDEALALLVSVRRAVPECFGPKGESAGRVGIEPGDGASPQAFGVGPDPGQHSMPTVDMAELAWRFVRPRSDPIALPVTG